MVATKSYHLIQIAPYRGDKPGATALIAPNQMNHYIWGSLLQRRPVPIKLDLGLVRHRWPTDR